ncbi:T7SS effector LXG polymorphic toxin [Enterococcus sp. AZ192]|uniref:T7SS effector LXG polymorphic toxin n=1 Tax=unclassified Enterococcus TaxID=2608891 RepID=UPI003D29FDA6
MGLIYSSSDSSQLISALQKNLQSGKEASEQLKSGSQKVIAAVDGKTLSGAAYTAGKGLFSDLIVPTISKVTSAIDSIESELQTYSSADALVSGEGTLDEDKLMQQIATKKAMKASADASAALARALSRNNPVAKVLDALLNVQSNLARMSNDFEDDIRELEKKLEKLHTFSSQTNGLFSNSLNDMKVAMQNCLILENTIVNSDGSYSLPEGVDKSWFNQLKKASDLNGIAGEKQPDVGNREYKLIDLGYGKIWLWVEKGKTTATAEDITVSLAYNEWLSRMIAKHGLGFVQGDRGKGMDELFYEQNATLIKELSTGIDSVTGKKLTTAEKLRKASLLANGLITMGVMVKGVVNISTPKNNLPNKKPVLQGSKNGNKPYKKASGANVPKVDVSKLKESASLPKKGGETVVGHALQKHAGRNPDIWGKIKGNAQEINKTAMRHVEEILNASGDFKVVKTKNGVSFLEKQLPDGRGIRLNMDGSFKGFIDQIR